MNNIFDINGEAPMCKLPDPKSDNIRRGEIC